jgi:nitrate/TMAO reductase-like tetraheme cytochrome c subunit
MPSRESSRPLRRWRWALLAVVAATLGTALVKRLDEDNRFCVACHLHGEIMRNMTAASPVALSSAHFAARNGPAAGQQSAASFHGHPERCFTCHSGEGVVGWTQVTVLSAWDAARWVAGDRHEPTSMRLPIDNKACLKCHANQMHGSSTAEETDRFHELGDHRGVTLPCVGCHQVHRPGERARHWLHPDTVRPQCARCHKDMAAAAGWN